MVIIDKNFNGVLSRDINDYPEGIVMVIDKPYRWTSADVIRKVKYAAIRHFCKKNLKVGHAGTLDPLATGVLLVCIGNACKRAQEFQDTGKEYVAGVCFGATTPSYDLEKDIDRTFPTDGVSAETINAVLPEFLGPQDQVAPLFSAKQVDGVRAYEIARKLYRSGQPLDEAAKEILQINRIDISELELLGLGLSSDSAGATPTKEFFSRGPGSWHSADASFGTARLEKFWSASAEAEDGHNASSRINVAAMPAGLPVADIRIACSKGTYIRSFARDIGEKLNSGAFLASLCRSRSGEFRVENAISVTDAVTRLSE